MEVQSSSSFKVRALLQQLCPHLLRQLYVFGTSEFPNCKASHEIRKDVDLLMHLYKQMILEMNKPAGTAVLECRSSARPGSMPVKENKRQKLFQPGHLAQKDRKWLFKNCVELGQETTGGKLHCWWAVSGWNFITFGGTEPVYYGGTKESFRSCHKEVRIMELSVCNGHNPS